MQAQWQEDCAQRTIWDSGLVGEAIYNNNKMKDVIPEEITDRDNVADSGFEF